MISLHETTSTMEEIRRREPNAPEGLTVVAEHQTEGRGRLDRQWTDLPGQSLLFSTLLRPLCSPEAFLIFPIAAGLAVSEAMHSLSDVRAQLKWPNDVLIDDRKVAGLLMTSKIAAGRVDSATIGIGINLHGTPDPAGMSAIALEHCTSRPVDRTELLTGVLQALGVIYQAVLNRDTAWLIDVWHDRAAWLGQRVEVETTARTVAGLLTGIDAAGRLLLTGDDGLTRRFTVGDVTRGIRPSLVVDSM